MRRVRNVCNGFPMKSQSTRRSPGLHPCLPPDLLPDKFLYLSGGHVVPPCRARWYFRPSAADDPFRRNMLIARVRLSPGSLGHAEPLEERLDAGARCLGGLGVDESVSVADQHGYVPYGVAMRVISLR